jgi:hypothetical protein
MRTVSGGMQTAEREPIVDWGYNITLRREVWSFASFAAQASSADLTIPQSWVMRATGNLAYAVYFCTDGVPRIKVVDTTNASDYGLGTSGVTSITTTRCMRPGVYRRTSDNVVKVFTANQDGSGIQLRESTLSSTTNAVTTSFSNYGPVFGPASAASSTRVCRVEAVCPTDGGILVAVGQHDFTNQLSTIQFYLVADATGTAASVLTLNTIIQMPLLTTYTDWGSNWYGGAKYCTAITAFYNATTKRVHVIANDQVHGRAVQFTIQQSVESTLMPVVPIDPESSLLRLVPASVSLINGWWYLTARMLRYTEVGQAETLTSAWDMALISEDGWNWSLGELTSFLCLDDTRGALLIKTDSPTTIYYAGQGRGYSSTATELQAPSSGYSSDLSDYLDALTIDTTTNTADSASVIIQEDAAAGGASVHDSNVHLIDSAVMIVKAGTDGTLVDIGRYRIDRQPRTVAGAALQSRTIEARDLGSSVIIDNNALVDADMRGRSVFSTDCTDIEAFSVKTPIHGDKGDEDITASPGAGLLYRGLNSPFMAFVSDAEDSGDMFAAFTVRFNGTDTNHQSSIGVIFGASEDGDGRVFLLPKAGSWGGYFQDRPKMRHLALPAVDEDDPDKDDTGWNLSRRVNNLWAAVLSGNIRTTAATGTYSVNQAFTCAANTDYDIVVRIAGRRAQMWAKARNYTPAQTANNAAYTMVSEFLFDYQAKRSQAGRDNIGLAISTDVAGSVDWFASAKFSDLKPNLTEAVQPGASAFARVLATGAAATTPPYTILHSVSSTTHLQVGMKVYLDGVDFLGFAKITNISGGQVTFDQTIGNGTSGGASHFIRGQHPADTFGYADSGSRVENTTAGRVTTDTGAQKLPLRAAGKALFISDDNTAASIRFIETDGVRHMLWSGSVFNGGTYEAWDATNPIADPRVWRMLYNNGRIFTGAASQYGMPTTGLIRVNKERIAYEQYTFSRLGVYPGDAASNTIWTAVRMFYAPAVASLAGLSTLSQWNSGANIPGDNLGDITSPAGLLFEVVSRSSMSANSEDTPAVYRVTGVGKTSGVGYVTLDQPYPNELRGPGTTNNGDTIIVSGRAMHNTEKARHDPDDPVVYDPRDSSGVDATVQVTAFETHTGLFQSAEDAIRRIAAMAGLRGIVFRNMHTTPAADASITLTTTGQNLPISRTLANFTLDAKVHIPGNSLSGGSVSSEKRLNIEFRGYYRLSIQQYTTSTDFNAGSPGGIRVGLSTTSVDISAPSSGDYRWLALTPAIPIGGTLTYNVAGTVTGANPNYTLTEDVTRLVDLRVAVHDNLVRVEINGQHICTFNLDRFTDGTNFYRRDTAGNIAVSYSVSPGSYTSTWRVLELGDEVRRHTVPEGNNAASSIATLSEQRHIRSRSTQTGGLEFSRFWVRDVLPAISENNLSHESSNTGYAKAGLVRTAGEATGEFLDAAHVAARGFRYEMRSNDAVLTHEAAKLESEISSRESEEFSTSDVLDGGAFVEAQPEDQFAFSYDGGGDRPFLTSVNIVATGVRFYTDEDLRLMATISGRRA